MLLHAELLRTIDRRVAAVDSDAVAVTSSSASSTSIVICVVGLFDGGGLFAVSSGGTADLHDDDLDSVTRPSAPWLQALLSPSVAVQLSDALDGIDHCLFIGRSTAAARGAHVSRDCCLLKLDGSSRSMAVCFRRWLSVTGSFLYTQPKVQAALGLDQRSV